METSSIINQMSFRTAFVTYLTGNVCAIAVDIDEINNDGQGFSAKDKEAIVTMRDCARDRVIELIPTLEYWSNDPRFSDFVCGHYERIIAVHPWMKGCVITIEDYAE